MHVVSTLAVDEEREWSELGFGALWATTRRASWPLRVKVELEGRDEELVLALALAQVLVLVQKLALEPQS